MMATIFNELRSQFDMVIIDTGPVLTCPDAMLIGQHVDTAVTLDSPRFKSHS